MLLVKNTSLDPWFNIATEEYLLKYLDTEIVMLWSSKPSIIVGKHQNTLAEINLSFVRKHNIPVVRRLSGGGTVFHDPGNINFTFIRRAHKENLVDFRAHTRPVIEFLQSLGVDARFEGKNDLRVEGLKISGNAEHVYKNKVLHHGTLLFDSNLENLNEAIKAREVNFESKAVKSVRSTVANISEFLNEKLTREEFASRLEEFFLDSFPELQKYELQPDDIRAINKLKEEKYTRWEWNFGWSPVYTFRNKASIEAKELSLELEVRKGRVLNASLEIDGNPLSIEHTLINELKDTPHKPEEIEKLLRQINFMDINQMEDSWELVELFF